MLPCTHNNKHDAWQRCVRCSFLNMMFGLCHIRCIFSLSTSSIFRGFKSKNQNRKRIKKNMFDATLHCGAWKKLISHSICLQAFSSSVRLSREKTSYAFLSSTRGRKRFITIAFAKCTMDSMNTYVCCMYSVT